MSKICTKCGSEKEFDEFHAQSKAKDGLSCRCKECVAQDHAERMNVLGIPRCDITNKISGKTRSRRRAQSFVAEYGSDVAEVFDSLGWKR